MSECRGREEALEELRQRLADGLAGARLSKKQVAGAAGLSRTTVQEAFRQGAGAPSAETVVAIARVLRLRERELLSLRRDAAAEAASPPGREQGPAKPISEWDPHDLEVHPAGSSTAGQGLAAGAGTLPGYVPRAHDDVLAESVRDAQEGRSRIVVLVGASSTGKTRACWEAVQPLARQGWGLWHPFAPKRARAALKDLQRVQRCTVVWLNEAQHYLGDPRLGEQVAAAVHGLLTDHDRGPVLVLGTLWREYADQYMALPTPGGADPYSRVRELLTGHTLTVPDTFDRQALRTAARFAERGDRLLADTLTRAGSDGRVTQDLAGAPELLRRYEHGTPVVRAVLEAAMDARRLGMGLHLPQDFLTDAAIDYVSDQDLAGLTEDWSESAFADLTRPVHGKQAPLTRAGGRPRRYPPGIIIPVTASVPAAAPGFRLADYLEQHGRATRRAICPRASFWHAACTHLTRPDDLLNLAEAAERRYRLQWAHHLRQRAADAGSTDALVELARTRKEAGDRERAEALYRQAAEAGSTRALFFLSRLRDEAGDRDGAEALARQAADAGDTAALRVLAQTLEEATAWDGAAALYRRAAEAGDTDALVDAARMREKAGDRDGAAALARQAADAGSAHALSWLARLREESGDRDGAEALARQAAEAGDTHGLSFLTRLRGLAGNWEAAEALARQAVAVGDHDVLVELAGLREKANERDRAAALYRQAADAGSTDAVVELARLREESGDRDGAEALARRAADGDSHALGVLMLIRILTRDWEGAEVLARQAAAAGDHDALVELARAREKAGDRDRADALAEKLADLGNGYALVELARMREKAGDPEGADALARQAADVGDAGWFLGGRWRYGLDAEGRPTPPWE
ncbi:hypothetical protein ACWGE1_26765 [Streptomyces sp. NPDC054932]